MEKIFNKKVKKMEKRMIVLDFERMKYPHTGLFHFCQNLGFSLQESIETSSEELSFYLPAKERNFFGKNERCIIQQPWHKLVMPSLKNYSVWHSTHQDSDYFPKNLPVVLTIHDINLLHNVNKSEQRKSQYIKALEHKIKLAKHVTFISEFTKNDVQRYIDLSDKPHTVIHNGCNIKAIEQLTTPSLSVSAPFFFTIGTIMEKKNFHVLPALLEGNDKHIIIAGITTSESYKQMILMNAKNLGVADRVHFTGPISENDKQWYLKNCLAFVFPSLTEGFGLPVVEAMHFGIPIFLSKYTSLPEIGGEVCYYFDSFNKIDMQHTIQQGLQHYSSTNTKEKIQNRAALFNWKKAATKYLEIYRSF